MRVSENEKVAALLYEKFPDGSDLDFNRIFDAVDAVQGSEPDMKSAKRFLYQYCDARRNRDIIRERYDIVFSPLHSNGKQFMMNPSGFVSLIESYDQERPIVSELLSKAEKEFVEAKRHITWAVSLLEKKNEKLVITAHYVCDADLKWISTVYHHRTYWAKEVCDRALKVINAHMGESVETTDCSELDRLIAKWKKDDREFRDNLPVEPFNQPLDELAMLMGTHNGWL